MQQGIRMRPKSQFPSKVAVARIGAGLAEFGAEVEDVDVNHLITKGSPDFLYFGVEGESGMPEIAPGDFVAVDTSKRHDVRNGDMTAEYVDNQMCVKRLDHDPRSHLRLVSRNEAYKPIEVNEYSNQHTIGLVTAAIRFITNSVQVDRGLPNIIDVQIKHVDTFAFHITLVADDGRNLQFMMSPTVIAKAIATASMALGKRLAK